MSKKILSSVMTLLCLITAFSFPNTTAAQAETFAVASTTESEKTVSISNSESYGTLSNSANRKVVKTPFIITFLRKTPEFFSSIDALIFSGTEVKVILEGENFSKVEINGKTGYMLNWWLADASHGSEGSIKLNRKYDHVYVGATNSCRTTATYEGSGTVTWSTDNTNVLTVNKTTGEVTGKNAGKANLIATDGTVSASIPVYCIYKWKTAWTGKALQNNVAIKAMPSSDSTKLTTLDKDNKFVVTGDDGGNGGWAYGYYAKDSNTKYWGFVEIKNISTKNTVSYYNNLCWSWPLKDESYCYINSPCTPRPSMGDLHRGIDIIGTSNQESINGKAIVSAFDGVVKMVGTDENDPSGCGYYICITSNTVDPVTNEKIVAIYMHMHDAPTLKSSTTVKAGDVIGYVGNTGNSTGPHLHFEANCKNAGIGDKGRSDYTNVINPLYFYMDKQDDLGFNYGCSAYKNGYSFYFYNYNAS